METYNLVKDENNESFFKENIILENSISAKSLSDDLKRNSLLIHSKEGSFDYELVFLLETEFNNLQLHSEIEKRKLNFHPEKQLNDLFINLDFLSEHQKSLIQYYLPFKYEISANLALLKHCLQTMLQEDIFITEMPQKEIAFDNASNTQVEQCNLDGDSYLGGKYISPKRCIHISISPISPVNLESFSAVGKQRIFFEQAIVPVFIAASYDHVFEIIVEEQKKEKRESKKESIANYLDMNILL